MNVFRDAKLLGINKRTILTIGSFDGVHLGHQHILKQVVGLSVQEGLPSVVVTFANHPRQFLGQQEGLFLLNTLDEKIFLLEKQGVENCVVLDFNKEVANMEAESFIKGFLVPLFCPKVIVIGFDHRFGKNRGGDIGLLKQFEKQFDFEVKEIPEYLITQSKINSTSIRYFLNQGKIKAANFILGYDYFFKAKVVEGKKLGRTIGFPTANLEIAHEQKLIPCMGVYGVKIMVENRREVFFGMMNIGKNPTVNQGEELKMEVHVFDFNEDLYFKEITIFFVEKLRDEIKFANIDALKQQLETDKKTAQSLFKYVS